MKPTALTLSRPPPTHTPLFLCYSPLQFSLRLRLISPASLPHAGSGGGDRMGQQPVSQAEAERQQILNEMKKKTQLLTDSSWIRQRPPATAREVDIPPMRRCDSVRAWVFFPHREQSHTFITGTQTGSIMWWRSSCKSFSLRKLKHSCIVEVRMNKYLHSNYKS